jgi:hypothetical protein
MHYYCIQVVTQAATPCWWVQFSLCESISVAAGVAKLDQLHYLPGPRTHGLFGISGFQVTLESLLKSHVLHDYKGTKVYPHLFSKRRSTKQYQLKC